MSKQLPAAINTTRKEPVASLSTTDQQLIDEMFVAVKNGDLASVTRYFTTNSKVGTLLAMHKDSAFGNLSIHYAAVSGNIEIVKLLLKCGADVNSRNDYGWTPLMLATFHGNITMVKLLTSIHRINLNASNDFGICVLQIAIYQKNMPILKYLVEAGAKLNQGNGMLTPLMMACHVGKSALVSQLLQVGGAETNAQSRLNSWTPLMYAVNSSANPQISKLLIQNGADVDVKTVTGQTALDIARLRSHKEVVDLLSAISAVKDSPEQSQSGVSIQQQQARIDTQRHKIFSALANDNVSDIKSILSADPRCIFERDPNDGMTPLMLACVKGDLQIVKLVLSYNAPINQKDDIDWTALKYAAYYNRPDIVEYLLSKGASFVLDTSLKHNEMQIENELRTLSNDLDILNMLKQSLKFSDESCENDTAADPPSECQSEISRTSSSSQATEKVGWFSKLLGKGKWKKSDSDLQSSAKPEMIKIPKMSSKKIKSNTVKARPDDMDLLDEEMQKSRSNTWGKSGESTSRSQGNKNIAKIFMDSTSEGNLSDSAYSNGMSSRGSVGTSRKKSLDTESKMFDIASNYGGSSIQEDKKQQSSIFFSATDQLANATSGANTPTNNISSSFEVIQQQQPQTQHDPLISLMEPKFYTPRHNHTREKSNQSAHSHTSNPDSRAFSVSDLPDRIAAMTSTAAEANDLQTFLHILDLDAYLNSFQGKGMNTIGDLSTLTDSDLQTIGMGNQGHRQLLILATQSWKAEQHVKQVVNVHDQSGPGAGRDYVYIPTVSSTYSYHRKTSTRLDDDSTLNSPMNPLQTSQQSSYLGQYSMMNSPMPGMTIHSTGFDTFTKSQSSFNGLKLSHQSGSINVSGNGMVSNTAPAAYYRLNNKPGNSGQPSNAMNGRVPDKHEMIAEMKKKKLASNTINTNTNNVQPTSGLNKSGSAQSLNELQKNSGNANSNCENK